MILTTFFFLLFLAILLIFLIPNKFIYIIKLVSLSTIGLVLFLSCYLLLNFDNNYYYYQFLTTIKFNFDYLNLYFSFGLDGLSLFFYLLSNLLIFLCILYVWNEKDFKAYVILLFILNLFLLLVFSVLDLILFYIFFEAILIPMYLIIGIWGSRQRKIRAVYLFFFYTLIGSLFLLISILYIYSKIGTLNLEILNVYSFTFVEEYFIWLAFFLSFASKIPLFPLHIWLPEAHVEAPTVGSILLAGILLKLGVYGFLRLSLPLLPQASLFFSPLIYLLAILGVIYGSLSSIRQTDLKRIIAYSSIAHMNLIALGIFSFNVSGITGAIFQSLSHGFVASALFMLIGILYESYHSRSIHYYGGLIQMMPIFSIYFLVFTLANIALPGTSSFVGEFLLLVGVFKVDILTAILATTGVILCAAYSLWVYNRIIFGSLKLNNTLIFKDLSYREFAMLFPLAMLTVFSGIYPKIFLNYINFSSILSYLIVI